MMRVSGVVALLALAAAAVAAAAAPDGSFAPCAGLAPTDCWGTDFTSFTTLPASMVVITDDDTIGPPANWSIAEGLLMESSNRRSDPAAHPTCAAGRGTMLLFGGADGVTDTSDNLWEVCAQRARSVTDAA